MDHPRSASRVRSFWISAYPSTSGSPMSLTRMSGCHCSTCSNASSALAADMTSAPEGSHPHAHELARVGLVVNDQNAQTLEDSRPDDLAVQRAARRFWLEAADAGGGQREIDREGCP